MNNDPVLDATTDPVPPPTRGRVLAMLAMCATAVLVWALELGPAHAARVFVDGWQVALTMVFGSFVAGSTAMGGGAVAFPVLTKVLGVEPEQARVFSLSIQTVGMGMASLSILLLRVPIDRRAVALAFAGVVPGMILGVLAIAPNMPPGVTRAVFSALVASLAVTMILRERHPTGHAVRAPTDPVSARWLLGTGVVGGVLSSIVGTGADVLVFALLVLRYDVHEKIATPTSVVLMALTALTGFAAWGTQGAFDEAVRPLWLAAAPVVAVGAPVGALISALLPRVLVVRLLLALIAIEVLSSLALLPRTAEVVVAGFASFAVLLALATWLGAHEHPPGARRPPPGRLRPDDA